MAPQITSTGYRFALALALVVTLFVAPAGPAGSVEIDIELAVDGNDRINRLLQDVVDATRLSGRRPPEPVTVLQRTQNQRGELNRALRAEGYYGGSVRTIFAGTDIDDPALFDRIESLSQLERISVRHEIVAGDRYRFRAPRILDMDTGGELPDAQIERGQIEVRADRPAESADVVASDGQILRQLQERGRPFAAIAEREVVVDHADRSMTVTWRVRPGPTATLGPVSFSGMERTREGFLARRVPFRAGAPYTPQRIDALRDEMAELGIFSTVTVTQADALDSAGRLPVSVEVVERAPRTIGLGASYASSEGFGARAYWQHRNFFGGAETLRFSAEVGGLLENKLTQPSFALTASYREPDFLRRRQNLLADLIAERRVLDAYTKEAVGGAVGLERSFSRSLKGSAGILVEHSRQRRDGERERFTLIGLPFALALDRSNNLLNPTSGFRAWASLTPYADTLNPAPRFAVGRRAGTAYLDLSSNGSTVLAGRAAVASLVDFGTSSVPFDRRIYSGGGGSVRGYAYQSLGPRDGKDPLGGRSSIELSAEIRQRVSGRFGMVAFADAGNVYETSLPKPGRMLRYAAGLGARYATDFGPIRLDVAVPLNRRSIDGLFGIYVSLGQAF